MRNIFLHIGCGKTGSSALQVWLWNNSKKLQECGIYYPTHGKEKIEQYSITSGNGVRLYSAFSSGIVEDVIKEDLSSNNLNLLYSSEAFQGLTNENLALLSEVEKKYNIKIKIIAFVRDVYDITYSLYLQGIKRHLYSETFKHYVFSQSRLQQFSVIRKFELFFNDIHVIHYDTVKKTGIDTAFCEQMGIDASSIEEMQKTIVNRSLDLFEAEILRLTNKEFKKSNPNHENSRWFSTAISDSLIYTNPEKKTQILYDKEAVQHLESLSKEDIDYINKKYFKKPLLSIFNQKDKELCTSTPEIPEEYITVIKSLIKLGLSKGDFSPKKINNTPNIENNNENKQTQKPVTLKDPDILREAAIILEKKGENKIAEDVITQAMKLRPQGQIIKNIYARLNKKNSE